MELTTHVKKYRIFPRVFDIANQLLTRHSPFAPFGQVDEWTAKPSPFSIQGSLLDFSQITAAKTLKNLYFLQTVTSKLSYKGKKTNTRKEKLKITYSVALVMAFLAAENENRQQGELPQANFGRVPERFLLSVRTKSITKNFVHWKLRPLFVLVMFQHMFSSWALAPTRFTIFIQGMSILLFSFIGQVDFFCQ